MTDVSNNDDMIYSRDVVSRLEELSDDLDGCAENEDGDFVDADGEDMSEEKENYDTLKSFAEEFESYAPDYHSGETAINEDYFTEYAQQLAEDIGAISNDVTWPCCHIDWEAAAESLKQDYTEIDFGGQAFWVR